MKFGLLPRGIDATALPLLQARAVRGLADGWVSVLLPAYLLALGLGPKDVGVIATATLLGSALATLAVGRWGHWVEHRQALLWSALLMTATGMGFAGLSSYWPLLAVAFVGTLNPSSGDVSVFLPLEQAALAEKAHADNRTALFARYSLAGSLSAAVGSLCAAVPQTLQHLAQASAVFSYKAMFALYGVAGVVVWLLYWRVPKLAPLSSRRAAPLGASRGIVIRLAALFCVDSFAGGLAINALLALWLFKRFDMPLAAVGAFFFWTGLCSAASQLAAPWLAKRIGLVNTMVYTHIPASLCLIGAALSPSLGLSLALLVARSLLSQMDVPARTAFVMSVVHPEERAAAASFTAVPRSLASAAGPAIGGALFATGYMAVPLLLCACLKIVYDLVLWVSFTDVPQARPVAKDQD